MGPAPTTQRAEKFLQYADVRLLCLLGIAGSLDEDIKLGDVVVASEINEFLGSSKAVPTESGEGFRLNYSGNHWPLDFSLAQAVRNFSLAGHLYYKDYLTDLTQLRGALTIPNEQLQFSKPSPTYYVAHIASGDIVGAAEGFAVELLGIDRKFAALEMEAAGLAHAAHNRSRPIRSLVIRGISDFSDSRKELLDRQGKGKWRRYAVASATRFLIALVRWQQFRDLVIR